MSLQENKTAGYGALIGASEAMREVYKTIERAAAVDLPVLITGESGTGKELAAAEIHRRSRRKNRPYVAVNMGALAPELAVSELFGHVKGAFTGALASQPGRFTEADGGTLLLDEIGTMQHATQVILLRVLETGTFRPVGAQTDRQTDVRLIAATNLDMGQAVQKGVFRQDLLFRLQVLQIALPPLREHLEDLPGLLRHFMEYANARFSLHVREIAPDAQALLRSYAWPGNIRELRNVVTQAAVLCDDGIVKAQHLPRRLHEQAAPSARAPHGTESGAQPPRSIPERAPVFHPVAGEDVPRQGIFFRAETKLSEIERDYVLKTLALTHDNRTAAAKSLGISRKTLYEKLKHWDSPHTGVETAGAKAQTRK